MHSSRPRTLTAKTFVEVVPGLVFDRVVDAAVAGVVDRQVEPPVTRQGLLDHGFDRLLAGDVRGHEERLATGLAGRRVGGDQLGGLLARITTSAREDDLGSAAREAKGGMPTDALAGPGDYRDLVAVVVARCVVSVGRSAPGDFLQQLGVVHRTGHADEPEGTERCPSHLSPRLGRRAARRCDPRPSRPAPRPPRAGSIPGRSAGSWSRRARSGHCAGACPGSG